MTKPSTIRKNYKIKHIPTNKYVSVVCRVNYNDSLDPAYMSNGIGRIWKTRKPCIEAFKQIAHNLNIKKKFGTINDFQIEVFYLEPKEILKFQDIINE